MTVTLEFTNGGVATVFYVPHVLIDGDDLVLGVKRYRLSTIAKMEAK